jgi:hypothetical protein
MIRWASASTGPSLGRGSSGAVTGRGACCCGFRCWTFGVGMGGLIGVPPRRTIVLYAAPCSRSRCCWSNSAVFDLVLGGSSCCIPATWRWQACCVVSRRPFDTAPYRASFRLRGAPSKLAPPLWNYIFRWIEPNIVAAPSTFTVSRANAHSLHARQYSGSLGLTPAA